MHTMTKTNTIVDIIMRTTPGFLCTLLLTSGMALAQQKSTSLTGVMPQTAIAQSEQNLLIPGIAAAKELPGMKEMPDPNLTYKVIFDIERGAENVDQLNPGLVTVGRIVNTLAAHGISAEHRKIAVIFHGAATDIVQNNDAFKTRNSGHDNPNIAVLRTMKRAGVDLRVCGQAVQVRKIDPKTIQPEVELDLGAVFTLMNLQLRGYVRIGD